MRHVFVVGLSAGLFFIAACGSPPAPMFDTSVVDGGRDGSASDASRDANLTDTMAPDVLLPDAGSDASGLDANDVDAAADDAGLDAATDDGGNDAATVGDAGCSTASQCNDGNACTIDLCSAAGACTHSPVSIDDGNVCTSDTCNTTSGAIAHTPITGIDDGDACTNDTCNTTSGAISHAPIAGCCNTAAMCTSGVCQSHVCVSAMCTDGVRNGSESDMDCGGSCVPCTIGQMCNANADCDTHACSGGRCVECNAPSDCGTNTECRTRTCNAHVCGVTNTPVGTATTSQMAGDCRENQCDGSGNVINAVQNADVPVDGNACTGDVCTAGVASNPPSMAGSACTSGGTVCNGAGACVQCVVPTDCTGTDTECRMRTCTSNTCGTRFVSAGSPVSSQTGNDCHRNECDGSGNVVNAIDDTDSPVDDGQQCTFDLCSSGVALHPPRGIGTTCSMGGGSRCDASGNCVQCNSGSDCGTSTTCRSYTCTTGTCGHSDATAGTPSGTQMAGDCRHRECDGMGVEVNAIDDADTPVDGLECTMDVCTTGTPSNPPVSAGTPCTMGGTQCNATGMCVTPPPPPTVTATSPTNGVSVVAGTTIAVTFSTAMSPATLTGQTVAGACSGSIQVSLDDFASCIAFSAAAATMSGGDTVATLTAAPGELINRTYKIRVTTAATSAAGTAMAAQFTQASGFATVGSGICGASTVVIAQVYGGGGNAGANYTNDFILLHNRGTTSITMTNWSVQYGSSGGTTWTVTTLNGTIAAGGYWLVQEGSGGAIGSALPTADSTGAINMSLTAGKVALVTTNVALSGACPTGGGIVDFIGWGTGTNCSETALATGPASGANTQAVHRAQTACTDSDNNASDFAVATSAPLNSATANVSGCGCVWNESSSGSEVDYCNVQFPLSLNPAAGSSVTVYGRIYEGGLTTSSGSAIPQIRGQVGYGPPTANPEWQAGWTWIEASYNPGYVDPSNDEYQATFNAPGSGTYRYAYRFSTDYGASWTYCDPDPGAGSNTVPAVLTFDLEAMPTMTVP